MFSFGALFILSYYFTLREFLEHSSIGEIKQTKSKEGQEKQRKNKEGWIKQLGQEELQVTSRMCDFLVDF